MKRNQGIIILMMKHLFGLFLLRLLSSATHTYTQTWGFLLIYDRFISKQRKKYPEQEEALQRYKKSYKFAPNQIFSCYMFSFVC